MGRKAPHRSAMFANMASSLILHKRIETTTAKAKALRMYVEPLITKSKDDTTHSRRVVFSYLQNKDAVSELFRDVAVKAADRPGGYTRLFKIGSRLGDNADMCIIELVDYNENLTGDKEASAKSKAGRRRRGARKKAGEEKAVDAIAPVESPDSDDDKIIEDNELKASEANEVADNLSDNVAEIADKTEENIGDSQVVSEEQNITVEEEDAASDTKGEDLKDISDDKKDDQEEDKENNLAEEGNK